MPVSDRGGDVPCRRCEGDGYLDIVDPETGGVIGPRPCDACGGSGVAANEEELSDA